jgi:hypothetical protein
MMSDGTQAPAGTAGGSPNSKEPDQYLIDEAARAARRRTALFGNTSGDAAVDHDHGLDGTAGAGPGSWALALSGGGIRSATFCLGVLQELAKPSARALAGLPPQAQAASARVGGLLPQFDYVSSASGGGFVAGFMQGLYARQPGEPDEAAAAVNQHLAQEPAPRVRAGTIPSPLAWLRENGRYLAPSGSGDMLYAFGFGVRNWLGIQSVIGAPIMLVTALLALAASLLNDKVATELLNWWLVPLAAFVFWVLPTAGAYWMTRDVPDGSKLAPMPWLRVAGVLATGAAALVAAHWPAGNGGSLLWAFAAGATGSLFAPAMGWPTYLSAAGAVITILFRCRPWAGRARANWPSR